MRCHPEDTPHNTEAVNFGTEATNNGTEAAITGTEAVTLTGQNREIDSHKLGGQLRGN